MAEEIFRPLTDVAYVWDLQRHAPDSDILTLSIASGRILLTEDYDFGDLIFRDHRRPPPGVIHLAFAGLEKAERYDILRNAADDILATAPGHYVVVGRTRIRRRPLPTA